MSTEVIIATDRAIKGGPHSFLGAFTSRHTDIDGYWAFGILIDSLYELRVSLIEGESTKTAVLQSTISRAQDLFADQVRKYHVPSHHVLDAHFLSRRSGAQVNGLINGHSVRGQIFLATATATMRGSKYYRCRQELFVAPNNPTIEMQSGRRIRRK
jgi:hypothetical protein